MTAIHKTEDYPQSFDEHVARLPEVTYADTAFKGDFDESPPKNTTRWIGYYIKNHTRCHEYLALNFGSEVGMLRQWKKIYCEPWTQGEAQYRQRQYLSNGSELPATLHLDNLEQSLLEWLKTIHALAIIGTFVAVGSPVMGLILVGLYWPFSIVTTPWLLATHFIPPLVLWVTYSIEKAGWLAKHSKPDKPAFSFHRDTGMVTIRTKKHSTTLPFREFQGCGMTVYVPNSAIKRLAFGIKHKHSMIWARMEGSMTAAYSAYPWPLSVRWELITHYMDVTRPLPDIPIFEPFRHLDPTTKEWDLKHGRPKNVWLNMTEEDYLKLMSDAVDAAKNYPVDSLSESKDNSQWKPAGDGKHWYQLG